MPKIVICRYCGAQINTCNDGICTASLGYESGAPVMRYSCWQCEQAEYDRYVEKLKMMGIGR